MNIDFESHHYHQFFQVKPGGELVCKMARGVKIVADIPIDEAEGQDWDLIVSASDSCRRVPLFVR